MVAPPTLTPAHNDIHYPGLIESLPIAIYICDEQGFITHYNAAAAELWGREPEKGVDQWTGAWKMFLLNGFPLPLEEYPMAITIKEKKEIEGEEYILERPDGTRRFIKASPKPIVNN